MPANDAVPIRDLPRRISGMVHALWRWWSSFDNAFRAIGFLAALLTIFAVFVALGLLRNARVVVQTTPEQVVRLDSSYVAEAYGETGIPGFVADEMARFNNAESLRVDSGEGYRDESFFARLASYEAVIAEASARGEAYSMVSPCEGAGSLLRILMSQYGHERCLRGDVPSYAAVLAVQDDLQARDFEAALEILDGALRLDVSFVVENDGPGGARNIVVTLPTYDESFRLDELEPGATGSFDFVAEVPAQVLPDFMPLVREQSFVLEWENQSTTRWFVFWLIVVVWAVVIATVAEREVGGSTGIDEIPDDGQLQLRLPDVAETPRANG